MPQNIVTEDCTGQEALMFLKEEDYEHIHAPSIAPSPEENAKKEDNCGKLENQLKELFYTLHSYVTDV